jgi:serine protease
MTVPNRTRVAAVTAAMMMLWLTSGAAQAPRAGLKARISNLSATAIDRGIRDNDPVRPVRTAAGDLIDRSTGKPAAYLRGSLIVKFREGTTAAARSAMVAMIGGTPVATGQPDAGFDIIAINPDSDAEQTAQRLSLQGDVAYAQARYRARPLLVPNDPLYSRQWNFPALDMERAWDINPGATPAITVAVIDTGVAYRGGVVRYDSSFPFQLEENGSVFPALGVVDVPFAAAPDLAGPDRFVAPRDFIWNDNDPLDMDGHGTHVAGTIGQLTNNAVGVAGMAFNVRIMPVKVIDNEWDFIFDSPFVGTDDTVARGIRYAVDNGAKVLNLSIGRNGPPSPVVHEAVAYAVANGAFVVVAGGNEYLDGNPIERYAEFAPDIKGMVAVGAVGRDLRRAEYSSTGTYVELAAPGGDASRGGSAAAILQQTFDFDLSATFLDGPSRFRAPRFDSFAYVFAQGTSMAAPHVAGFAALLMQQGITDPAAIEAAMERYATDLGAAGRDDEYGYGLINPRVALRGMGLAK